MTVARTLGSQGGEREINRRQRERREKSMASFFPVNCILLSAEDSRGGICKEGPGLKSLSLFLISSLSGLLILFLNLSGCPSFAESWLPGREKTRDHVKQSLTKLYAGSGCRQSRIYKYSRLLVHLFKKKRQEISERNWSTVSIEDQIVIFSGHYVTQRASPHI